MLLELTIKGQNTAQAKTADGKIINFTKTNSSWYDHNINGRKVGDTWTVADDAIRVSPQGNTYIERLGADKALIALQLETAYAKRDAAVSTAARAAKLAEMD